MSPHKYQNELRKIVESAGLHFECFEVGKHLKLRCKEGTIVAATTPGDRRNLENLAAIARRMALRI